MGLRVGEKKGKGGKRGAEGVVVELLRVNLEYMNG